MNSSDFGLERDDDVDTGAPRKASAFLVGVAPIDVVDDFFLGLYTLIAELNIVPAAIFHLRSS